MKAIKVNGLFIGKAKEIGVGLISATDKQPINHRLWLWPQGLGSDEQGDIRFHGGPERVLHHYPAEHYAHWKRVLPQIDWKAPDFGENLSTYGLLENRVCIGDVFRWGDALLQVSQPRSPCYRLSHRSGIAEMPQWAQESGRFGWYYRVLKAGFVSPENSLQLVQRNYPGLTVAQAIRSFYQAPLERAGLQQLVSCYDLSVRWRDTAARRLATGRIEDWSARLYGQAPEGLRA
ncbi:MULTISPECIES: MOSC domain-containing protein [Pseudomonas]|uniref:MOSC domain-containing protein n=1 Tax=Pseudomonas TaxID=286 RepID=UPI00257D31E5|nr:MULTISPECIES: MOSC domain-containing protein [Pseudomonas]